MKVLGEREKREEEWERERAAEKFVRFKAPENCILVACFGILI